MSAHKKIRLDMAIDGLERLASSATRGPWIRGDYGVVESMPNNRTGSWASDHIATCACVDDCPDNAGYIAAAFPDLILEIIAEIKNLREQAKPQPAAHLTIPGALEWDGDNGTHGADRESRADGESAAAIATLKALGYTHADGTHWKPPVGPTPRFALIDDLCAQLASTEQSRRSFFDLSQDLEKRLAERDALLSKATAFVQNLCTAAGSQPSVATGYLRDILDVLSASAEPSAPTKQVFTFDLEHFATKERRTVTLTKADVADGMEDTLYEKLGEQICQCQSVGETNVVDCNCDEYIHDFELVSSMASAEPAKTKTCIECDQPYCNGVCVERGDQDYDRDQAAKEGDQ